MTQRAAPLGSRTDIIEEQSFPCKFQQIGSKTMPALQETVNHSQRLRIVVHFLTESMTLPPGPLGNCVRFHYIAAEIYYENYFYGQNEHI